MSNDQDGCEWVSGTGLPGLSRTKGRLTVVCVCVRVLYKFIILLVHLFYVALISVQ